MRVPSGMSKPLPCLPERLIARVRAVGCSLGSHITLLLDPKSVEPASEEGLNRVVDLLFNVAETITNYILGCLQRTSIDEGTNADHVIHYKSKSSTSSEGMFVTGYYPLQG